MNTNLKQAVLQNDRIFPETTPQWLEKSGVKKL